MERDRMRKSTVLVSYWQQHHYCKKQILRKRSLKMWFQRGGNVFFFLQELLTLAAWLLKPFLSSLFSHNIIRNESASSIIINLTVTLAMGVPFNLGGFKWNHNTSLGPSSTFLLSLSFHLNWQWFLGFLHHYMARSEESLGNLYRHCQLIIDLVIPCFPWGVGRSYAGPKGEVCLLLPLRGDSEHNGDVFRGLLRGRDLMYCSYSSLKVRLRMQCWVDNWQ